MGSKLTKRTVDAAKPGATIWDSEIKGFGLRVSKGGAKSYVLKYRRGTIQRWLTIGRHGAPWTPTTARKEALKLLGQVATGRDPAANRAQDRKAETFGAFADRYIEEYAKAHKKPVSVAEDKRNLKNHAKPALGRLQLKEVKRSDVAQLHTDMKAIPYSANRVRALLSKIFNWAEAQGLRLDGSNPCRHVKPYPEKKRKGNLSPKELLRLGKALKKAEDEETEDPYVIGAIRLLLFTGARLSEILTLRRDCVDFRKHIAILEDSKTGEKTIALPAPALAVLKSLPRQKSNPYFICGRKPGERLINLQRPWRRIRAAAKLPNARIHDLRHSFGNIVVDSGHSLRMVGALLGHKRAETSLRYAAISDDPRLIVADAVAAQIAATMEGKGGKVVSLKKRK